MSVTGGVLRGECGFSASQALAVSRPFHPSRLSARDVQPDGRLVSCPRSLSQAENAKGCCTSCCVWNLRRAVAVSGCRSLRVVRVSHWIQLARCSPDQARRPRRRPFRSSMKDGTSVLQAGGSRIFRAQLNRHSFSLHIAAFNDDQRITLFNFSVYFEESCCRFFTHLPNRKQNNVSNGNMSL